MHRPLWLRPLSDRLRVSRHRGVYSCLETLWERLTPTTFTPTTFGDDGMANSLRGAITQAINDSGTAADTIQLSAGT